MWILAALPLLASVLPSAETAALGGVIGHGIPGVLPLSYVKAPKPIGDGGPNDVYQHLKVRGPVLSSDEVVIYPFRFGFERGQDPENSIYEVHNVKELQAEHGKPGDKKKHSKHNKHGKQQHSGDDHHHHQQEQHNNHIQEAPSNTRSSYNVPPSSMRQPQQQNQKRLKQTSSYASHPHFG